MLQDYKLGVRMLIHVVRTGPLLGLLMRAHGRRDELDQLLGVHARRASPGKSTARAPECGARRAGPSLRGRPETDAPGSTVALPASSESLRRQPRPGAPRSPTRLLPFRTATTTLRALW